VALPDQLRNNGVVKFADPSVSSAGKPAAGARVVGVTDGSAPLPRPASGESAVDERDTRGRVLRSLLEEGPATAAALAGRLGLTAAGVRRHLDHLADEALVEAGERAPYGPTAPRTRGRPARVYALTERGRATAGPADDDLAASALRFLRASAGDAGVVAFAEERIAEQRRRFIEELRGVPEAQRPAALADLLSREGFAASVDAVPGALSGVQICQHHCPVAHVAAEFPELCDAEARMFAEVLGTHVQRLATLAHGDGVCTTHLPLTPAPTPTQTAGDRSNR
jgi:predicted ArsR family transcriptional regulator